MMTKKIVLIGPFNSGKTCMVTRLIRNSYYSTSPTIGASFSTWKPKNADGYLLGIWDTAGQERFASIVPLYLRDSLVVIYCHPINKPFINEHVLRYYNTAKESSPNCKFIIAVTMTDLQGTEHVLVTQSQIEQLAAEIKIDSISWTSSLTGQGVHELFENIYYNFANNDNNKKSTESKINLTVSWKQKFYKYLCF